MAFAAPAWLPVVVPDGTDPTVQWHHDGITITDDPAAVDLDVVHGFLVDAYWSPGVPRDVVERAIAHSLCLTAIADGHQVGFARAVTDRATFVYVCDVFVLPVWRGRGLARAMTRLAIEHPDTRGARRVLLGTRDAHGVYAPLGFEPTPRPENLLEIRRDPRVLYGIS